MKPEFPAGDEAKHRIAPVPAFPDVVRWRHEIPGLHRITACCGAHGMAGSG